MEVSKMQTDLISQCTKTQMWWTQEKSTDGYWWENATSFLAQSGCTRVTGDLIMCSCNLGSPWFCFFRLQNQSDCPMLEVILEKLPWNATTFASWLIWDTSQSCGCISWLLWMQWITVVIWCLFRYYVGVLNKKTMQMEVHSAQVFNLCPVIPGIKRQISSMTYQKEKEKPQVPDHHPGIHISVLKHKQVLSFWMLMCLFFRWDSRDNKGSGHFLVIQRQGKATIYFRGQT